MHKKLTTSLGGRCCQLFLGQSRVFGALKGFAADLTVAGAKPVGLQTIKNAKRVLWIAADIEIIDRDVLNYPFRINNKGRTIRHACV